MSWIAQYWIEVLFTAIVSGLGVGLKYLHSQIKRTKFEEAAISEGMKSLLRDRLIQSYNYYVHTKKECPIYARDNIRAMHRAYADLGGNGTITELVDDIMELPTENKTGGEI